MKKIIFLTYCLLPVLSFGQQAPLKLWYTQPATHFEEALVLGNGTQGATVFGGLNSEKIYLNDITLWSGEPVKADMNPDAHKYLPLVREALKNENYKLADSLIRNIQGKFSESFAPLGTLFIDFDHKNVKNYYRDLSLDNASATVKYKNNNSLITREYFYSKPHNAFFIRIKSDQPQGLSFKIRFSSLLKYNTSAKGNSFEFGGRAPVKADPSYLGNTKDPVVFEEGRGTKFYGKIVVLKSSGIISSNDSTLIFKKGQEIVLAVNLATSFNDFEKDPFLQGKDEKSAVNQNITKLKGQTWNSLKLAHEKDYKKYYDRLKFEIGGSTQKKDLPTDERLKAYASGAKDPYLETLYFQYGRYLLISSSRTPYVPANLQGLWNPYIRPPWSSNYTMNINAEENYWPSEITNLSEMHMPFLTFIENLEKTGKITAKTFYNASGWAAHHNSDIWAMTNPVGNFGKGDPSWANWAMGATWATIHLWDHYLFNQDKEFLKNKAYPLMKGAAEFCLDMLVKDSKGNYVTSPGTSPENIYITDKGYKGATLYGATADIAMIKELFIALIQASNILESDYDFKNRLEEVLANLHPYQKGKKGQLLEWYHDWDDAEPQHRHQSHLYGLYPGLHINMSETPGLAQAAKTSLEIKGDETTGWSKGWRINLWARLWDGNRAYKMYRELLRYVEPDGIRPRYSNGGGTYPNLFDAHPPFQIDGNFGGTAAVVEMLMQSTPETIFLLPALPNEWENGTISGIKARGGFELSLKWAENKLSEIKIVSKSGGKTTLNYKGKENFINLKPGEARLLKF